VLTKADIVAAGAVRAARAARLAQLCWELDELRAQAHRHICCELRREWHDEMMAVRKAKD
jgi:hypothetical protein